MPSVQDQLAKNILEDSLAGMSDTERHDIELKLAEADADFEAGRFTDNGKAFWTARMAHAKGMRPA